MDALACVGQGNHYLCIDNAALLYGYTVHHNGLLHDFCGFEVAFQNTAGGLADLRLMVEHQRSVIHIGYVGDYLHLYGLLVELRLSQGSLYLTLGVQ